MTSLLQLLTNVQQKKGKPNEPNEILNIIGKISKLLNEISTLPISKILAFRTDYTKQCLETSDKLNNLITEHSAGPGKAYEKLLKDIRKAEKQIDEKNDLIATLKEKIEENRLRQKIKAPDPVIRLKNSSSVYQTLKAELKFNAGQFKKYKKLLTEKEFEKLKLVSQLEHLKRKTAKVKEKKKLVEEPSHTSTSKEVFYGGMLTKYVGIKHDKNQEKPLKMENCTNTKKAMKSIIKTNNS